MWLFEFEVHSRVLGYAWETHKQTIPMQMSTLKKIQNKGQRIFYILTHAQSISDNRIAYFDILSIRSIPSSQIG